MHALTVQLPMDYSKSVLLVNGIFILIMIIATEFAASSLASDTRSCSLQIGPSPSPLLNDSSCRAAFDVYVYALGRRANQTGKIFLNSLEQRFCLHRMKVLMKGDVSGCGIQKLTSGGGGGCSDFSIADVGNLLSEELTSLGENCQLQNEKGLSISCSSCMITWKAIKRTRSDLCRMAVLVSLISSTMDNDTYVHALLRCLGTNNSILFSQAENLSSESNQKEGRKRGG